MSNVFIIVSTVLLLLIFVCVMLYLSRENVKLRMDLRLEESQRENLAKENSRLSEEKEQLMEQLRSKPLKNEEFPSAH